MPSLHCRSSRTIPAHAFAGAWLQHVHPAGNNCAPYGMHRLWPLAHIRALRSETHPQNGQVCGCVPMQSRMGMLHTRRCLRPSLPAAGRSDASCVPCALRSRCALRRTPLNSFSCCKSLFASSVLSGGLASTCVTSSPCLRLGGCACSPCCDSCGELLGWATSCCLGCGAATADAAEIRAGLRDVVPALGPFAPRLGVGAVAVWRADLPDCSMSRHAHRLLGKAQTQLLVVSSTEWKRLSLLAGRFVTCIF